MKFHALLALLGLFGLGAAAGGVSALGRPGADLFVLHIAALLALLMHAARTDSYVSVVALALGFGCGEGVVSFAGSISWGKVVPIALTLIFVTSHRIPLVLWTRFVAGRSASWARFMGTVCVSALLAQMGELVGFPSKLATAIVTPLPELVAGARLFGADIVTGLLDATLVEVAIALARSSWSLRGATSALRAGLPGLALLAASSALAHLSAPPATGSLQVGIPQVNAGGTYSQSRLLAPSVVAEFDRTFDKLLLSLESSDLLVTTEAYDNRFGLMLPAIRDAWSERSGRFRQAAVVTSYLVDDAGGKVNAAGVFAADGRFLGAHEKVALAPFGEAPLTAGTAGYRVFEVLPNTRLGVLICLESHLRRPGLELVRAGADLLVVTTSDITFGSGLMVFEHLAMSQLRAIELGRSLTWASNAGPSGVVERFGHFEGGVFRKSAAVRGLAHTYSGQTPYVRFFELWWSLPWLGLAAALIGLHRSPRLASFGGEPHHSRRLLWLGAGALAVVPGMVLTAPALIELRRGEPARAPAAIAELWRPAPALSAADPFERFRSDPEYSARGAVAYFLEYYYGLTESGDSPKLPPSASLSDVRAHLLRLGAATRDIDLSRVEPRVATLLRLRDGTWAVVDSQEEGALRLVAPFAGRAGAVTAAQLRVLATGSAGLVPRALADR